MNPLNRGYSSLRMALGLCVALVLLPSSLSAHMLQYLTWFKVERNLELHPTNIRLTYNCRFDPSVFDAASPLMDTDGDTSASEHEIGSFCMQADLYLQQDLAFLLDGQLLTAREESFFVPDNNSGFQAVFIVALPEVPPGPHIFEIIDPGFLTMPGFSSDSRTTSGLALSHDEQVDFVDVANQNKKVRKVDIGTGFRSVFVLEKKESAKVNSQSTSSSATLTTSSKTGGAS